MNKHALSFDVENWYDGNLHRDHFTGHRDDRVVGETTRMLACLAEASVRATFFIVGEVAERHPDLVRAVARGGHEVACHAYKHERIATLTPASLHDDLKRGRAVLQDLSGQPVTGYRTPSWSLYGDALSWAPQVIAEAGFHYSSSVFPMRTPYYGVAGAPHTPWYHPLPGGGTLPELPPAVARVGPLRIPFGGGIYWRLLPDGLIARLLQRSSLPAIVYLHPWELNPELPPVGGGVTGAARLVLTVGIRRSERSLVRMLRQFAFDRIDHVYAHEIEQGVVAWAGSIDSAAAVPSP